MCYPCTMCGRCGKFDPDSPLYTMENVLLTPHMGWKGLETRQRLVALLSENIRAYLAGAPIHVVS